MNSLVVLFSVLALSVANASLVAPLAYQTVVPGTSVLQYSTSVLHGSPLYGAPAVYGASVYGPGLARAAVVPAVAPLTHSPLALNSLYGIHSLKKRSLAPLAYSTPLVSSAYAAPVLSAYPSPHVSAYSSPILSSPLLASPLAYSGIVPRALSVHPY